MRVGYYGTDYANKRNIIGIVENIKYMRVHDVNEPLVKLLMVINKLLNKSVLDVNDRRFKFNDLNLCHVDILHFFNTISFGQTPWITTFETIIPRFKTTLACHHGKIPDYAPLILDKEITKALEVLSNKSCKKLIAISECSLNMQKEFLRYFPHYYAEIESKLIHAHPPQDILIESYESKCIDVDEQIKFAFVGGAFFRKGGMEILETFGDLRKNHGYNLKLTIVSSMTIDNYATKEGNEDIKRARSFIHMNRDWIDYYYHLSNHEVLALMRKSHIGLLPTYADTYGYSVLEFQASGCPVISTNVRALPEINNNNIGWQIKVPKNHLGEAIYTTEEDRLQIKDAIKKGLNSIVSEIFRNRGSIIQKANAALEKIRTEHSREKYSRRLSEIYHQAL